MEKLRAGTTERKKLPPVLITRAFAFASRKISYGFQRTVRYVFGRFR